MTIPEKYQTELLMYWFTVILVFIILGRYGKQAIEWVLMKLYEFFIQKG
jgi:hypothetical protein